VYNVAVHVLRITDSRGLFPNDHAQNIDVMYDFPARGGIETDNELISLLLIICIALATSFKKDLAEKNSGS